MLCDDENHVDSSIVYRFFFLSRFHEKQKMCVEVNV